ELYAGLERATLQFAEDKDAGRSGVVAALETVLRFLQQSSVISSHGFIAPLARLHSDLLALDDGNVSSLLAPKSRSGRARASDFYDGLKGLAVFTVQALTTTSMNRLSRICACVDISTQVGDLEAASSDAAGCHRACGCVGGVA